MCGRQTLPGVAASFTANRRFVEVRWRRRLSSVADVNGGWSSDLAALRATVVWLCLLWESALSLAFMLEQKEINLKTFTRRYTWHGRGFLQFEGLVRAAKVYTSTKMNVGASEKVLNWFNSCYFTLSCQRCKVSGSVQSEPGSNRTLTSSRFIIHFSLNGIVNDWIYTVFYRPVIRKLISS